MEGGGTVGWCLAKNGVTSKLSKHLYIPTAPRAKTSPPSHDRGSRLLGDGGVRDGETRGATRTWPGGDFGDAEERVSTRGWRAVRSGGWTSRRRQFQQVFIGLRFLLGSTKEESRKPVGSFSGRRRQGQEGGDEDEEISAIEILGSLSSLRVSRRQRERSKKGGAE